MIIFKTVTELHQYLENQRAAGKTIGFIPTMGALHQGHLSLVERSNQLHPVSVSSIFVNPTQFNDPKDFQKYPVTIERDCLMLERQHSEVLFLPSVMEMYPKGLTYKQHFNLGYLEKILEGVFRPGHYQGVCQVVQRLLEIVQPNELFLGQKDWQQCMVIKKLVEIMGTQAIHNKSFEDPATLQSSKIKVTIAPTLREADGLAMSSRNMRLDETDRQIAPAIFRQLEIIKENFGNRDVETLKAEAVQNLLAGGFTKVDYVEIADTQNLLAINKFDPNKKAVALVAAFINEVRLIDNILL